MKERLTSGRKPKLFVRLVNKRRKYLLIDLSHGLNLPSLYTQYIYKDERSYLAAQTGKTKRRLSEFMSTSGSIFWSHEKNIEKISEYLKIYFGNKSVSGLCMGSRSGEEQAFFTAHLPGSLIFGVELEASASVINNTIIADFHDLSQLASGSQDFIYSNSHDQSDNFLKAINEWLRLLVPGGLLILEHSRAHGKLRVGSQDPCGIESEILPFLLMMGFQNQITLERITTPVVQFEDFHLIFVFKKN